MQTFAVHFNAISGSNWVQGLVDEESMAPKPCPTLTLAVAAVSHYSNVGPFTDVSIGGACSSTVVFWCPYKGQSFGGAELKESCEVAYHDQSCHGYAITTFDI